MRAAVLVGFNFMSRYCLLEGVNYILRGSEALLAVCRSYGDDQVDIPHFQLACSMSDGDVFQLPPPSGFIGYPL